MINESTTPVTVAAENLNPIVVKSKLEKALISIEAGIQTLHTAESKLVYNSDNLQNIADFIAKVKAAKKKVEEQRVELKKPHKENGDAVDDGAKLVSSELELMLKRAGPKYIQMVTEQNRLQKIQNDENKRIKDIKDSIDTVIMTFSTKIAEAKDLPTLLDLERRLNLETANEKRYQEQLPDLKSRCEAIRSLLSLQKQNVKGLEGLQNEATNALEMGQDEKLEEIEAKKDEMTAKVEETRTIIQETAINQSTATRSSGVTQVFNTVKPKRRTWKYEVKDIETLYKKCPGLVDLAPNEEKIKEILKEKIADGETKDKESIDFMGLILFYVDKKYI